MRRDARGVRGVLRGLSARADIARTAALLGITRLAQQRRLSLATAPVPRALTGVLRSGDAVVAAGLPRGLRLAGPEFPLEHPHAHHMLRGTLEIPVQEALRRHLGPGGTMFDIGANVGFFSLIGARLAGPSGRVHAFEPLPANAARIRAHAAANGFGQVEVREVALGDETGTATLSVPEEGSWAYLERYSPEREVPGRIEVELTTVDAVVEEGRTGPPDVVKIDAEGAEVEILAGMERTLGAHRPAVISEMHTRNAEFVALAESLGYAVTNLEGTEPPAEAHENVHVLALPA